MEEITKRILELIREFKKTPREINEGLCGEFAARLIQYFEDAVLLWKERADGAYHTFVKLYDKFYDAEAPFGVKRPGLLPFFRRYRERKRK